MADERQMQTSLNRIEPRHLKRYEIAKEYCKNKKVLDVACGCGYGSNVLSEVATSVTGGDYSDVAINYANSHWLKKNIDFKKVNIKDKPIIGEFDVMVSLETLEHIDHSLMETIEFYKSNLNSDGVLIVSHPENEDDLKLNPFHVHFNITKEKMVKLLEECGFDIIDVITQQGYENFYNYLIYIAKLKSNI